MLHGRHSTALAVAEGGGAPPPLVALAVRQRSRRSLAHSKGLGTHAKLHRTTSWRGWLPSFRPVAAAVAAVLLASTVQGQDAGALADRFSIGGVAAPPTPRLTLLDPSWMLPSIESLDLAAAEDHVYAGQHLIDESVAAA